MQEEFLMFAPLDASLRNSKFCTGECKKRIPCVGDRRFYGENYIYAGGGRRHRVLYMEGIGKTILKQFAEAGAIAAVDYDNDFLVDRELSQGDETFFNVGLQPVDSAEKLYFTIATR